MFNSTTKSYTLEDASGSYSWIVEALNGADYQTMTDAEIHAWIDTLISNTKDYDVVEVEARAYEQSYPRYGYTTADVYEDAESWLTDKLSEIDSDYADERESVFRFIKNWINIPNQQHEVWLPIPAAYNAGECRFSKETTGKRGGKSWQRLTFGIAATGGNQQMFLTPGVYKRTHWSNGWAHSVKFIVTNDGDIEWLDN